ncbi:hypothetical protein EVAR_72573_1 [Eumeta japonica]|uniref:Protein kinase domain-containing protein n=1 Tax=Eumeta variegata TaxID=151549 RepID=A0A4C1T7X7_EUMVA|nr:hypothetical protein EVAR_72573_1 [Eumeta japonica]
MFSFSLSRDLKPENVVFFEKLGVVKLTDFGFSNKFSPGQKLETFCGSLAYSAPEILLGDSYDAPAVAEMRLRKRREELHLKHIPFSNLAKKTSVQENVVLCVKEDREESSHELTCEGNELKVAVTRRESISDGSLNRSVQEKCSNIVSVVGCGKNSTIDPDTEMATQTKMVVSVDAALAQKQQIEKDTNSARLKKHKNHVIL